MGEQTKEQKSSHLGVSALVCIAAALLLTLAYAVYRTYWASSGITDTRPVSTPTSYDNLVQTQLLADVAGVVGGQTFTLGVHFNIKPGWHIYWKDPGDAGLPTTVKFSLPEGFHTVALEYPEPDKFVQPGDITGYGYKDSVMLIARVQPPAKLTAGATISISAEARWLACENSCVPGKAQLQLNLPVTAQAIPAHRKLFTQWMAKLPEKLSTK